MSGSWRVPRLWQAGLLVCVICFVFALAPVTAGAAGSTVEGYVSYDSNPVMYGAVDLWNLTTGDPPLFGMTDEWGWYQFTDLPAGDYYIDFWSENSEWFLGSSDTFSVDGLSWYEVDGTFSSPYIVAVSGNVYDDSTMLAIPDVEVAAYVFDAEQMGWTPVNWATTDDAGDYWMDASGLTAGKPFRVGFASATHVGEYYDDATSVGGAQELTWNGADPITGIDAGLKAFSAAPGTVEGHVTFDGVPCVDWTVELYNYDSGYWGGTSTDVDGHYSMDNLDAGMYEVTAMNSDMSYVWTKMTLVNGDTKTVDFAWAASVPAITGSVTDAMTGAGVTADVTVYYYDEVSTDLQYCGWVQADADGSYTVDLAENLAGGTFFVTFDATGYTGELYDNVAADDISHATQVFWEGGGVAAGIDAQLDPLPADITGTVTDAVSGEPIESAGLLLWSWNPDELLWEWFDSVSTDANGDYAFYGVPSGMCYLEAGADGHLTAANDAFTFSGTPLVFDFALDLAPDAISGTVTEEGSGAPIADAWVDAHYFESGSGEWWYWDSVTSGPDGTYAFNGSDVEAGVGYALSFSTYFEHYPETYDNVAPWDFANATLVTWDGVTETTGIDAALALAPVVASGTVVDEVTGEPLEGASAYLWLWDAEFAWWNCLDAVSTQADGTYQFRFPAYDGDQLKVSAKRKLTHAESSSEPFVWDGTSQVVDLPLAALTGDSSTISGTVTFDGAPIDGALVRLWSGASGWAWEDIADAGGGYEFTGLPADEYLLEFWTGVDGDVLGQSESLMADGMSSYVVDGTFFSPQPAISGTVTQDGSGDPIAGAWVDLHYYDPIDDAWYWWTDAMTDANGDYTFDGADIEAGVDYAVMFWADGFYQELYDNVQDFASASLVSWNGVDEVTGIDAALAPYPEVVSGTITDAVTGAPINGAGVYLWLNDPEFGWDWIDAMSTAADGTYVFSGPAFEGDEFAVSATKPPVYAQSESAPFTWAGESVTIDLALSPVSKSVQQIAGATRFSGSVAIAASVFDPLGAGQWPNVHDVILACGDDRAAADPLGAAGLTWAYNAPLFLTSSTSVDPAVKEAFKQIAAANGDVTVHIVGGRVSVPDARYNEILAYVGNAGTLTKDRLLIGGDRYDLSAEIAQRMADELGDAPDVVLLANGQDYTKFFDALSLSPIAACDGYPILLANNAGVPAATQAKLNEIKADGGATTIIVGGGPKTVSGQTVAALGATRWAGSTRYGTALAIADGASARGWLAMEPMGVAAKLPDALTGGSVMGWRGSALVLTDGTTLTSETGNWLAAHSAQINTVFCFGGDKSLSPGVRNAIYNKIK